MVSHLDLGLLLVTYKRSQNLAAILNTSFDAGIRKFFVIVDGLREDASDHEIESQQRVIEEVNGWSRRIGGVEVFIKRLSKNNGCSSTVLQGVDWISSSVGYFCVLEDDCIPSQDFFVYAKDAFNHITNNPKIMLASGAQFVPASLTANRWSLSNYALTWGWITTSERWEYLRMRMRTNSSNFPNKISSAERSYWKYGANRALKGFVDVWDTVLVKTLIADDLFSILPGVNLVSNVGDDTNATHTFDDSTWLHIATGNYLQCNELEYKKEVDCWLKENFYQISFRHLVTTRITALSDVIGSYLKR